MVQKKGMSIFVANITTTTDIVAVEMDLTLLLS